MTSKNCFCACRQVLLTLLFVITPIARAQQFSTDATPRFEPTLLVDVNAMSDADRAAVIKAVATLSSTSERVVVQPHDNIFTIVNTKYRYYQNANEKKYFKTAQELAKLVAQSSGLKDNYKLKPGQVLTVPDLPQRPFEKGAESAVTQVFDQDSGKVSALHMLNQAPASVSTRAGSTWSFPSLDQSKLKQVLDTIPDDVRRRVLGRSLVVSPAAQTVTVHLLTEPDPPAGESMAQQTYVPVPITLMPHGKYLIIDKFTKPANGACSHGDMVKAVALATFERYQANKVFDQAIITKNVDFYAVPTNDALDVVRHYAKSMTRDNETQTIATADYLHSHPPPPSSDPKELQVPLLYVAALNYEAVTSSDVAQVSMSFYARFDGFQWRPPEYVESSDTILLAAVADAPNTSIEDTLYEKYEPMQTFRQMSPRFGFVTVGALGRDGSIFGMASKKAEVTSLGYGFGWQSKVCDLRNEGGTSFSTPEIGAMLFLARAFWASKKIAVDAREARLRLLAASIVNPAIAGRYASAGVPVLERLLLEHGRFAFLTNQTRAVDPVGNATVTYKTSDGGTTTRSLGRGEDGKFCGLQVVGGKPYLLDEITVRWREVEPTAVSITIGGHVYDDLNKFAADYGGIICL